MDLILGYLVGGLYKLWTYFKSVEEYLTQIYFKYDKHRERGRERKKEQHLYPNEVFFHFLT